MSDLSRESFDCQVFDNYESALAHGKGGIYYGYAADSANDFPSDVRTVYIGMPVSWFDIDPEADTDTGKQPVSIGWTTTHPLNASFPHHWALSGTREKPTLSPSLNWIGIWHGWLRDGRMESC